MVGKRSSAFTAFVLAITMVSVAVPMTAVADLPIPPLPAPAPVPVPPPTPDPLPGAIHAAIGTPGGATQFSRIDKIGFFDATADSGCAPMSWVWQFGDGKLGTHRNETHQYVALGLYDVNLTVVGACGKSDTAHLGITIVNLLPVAALATSPAAPVAGDSVKLDGSQSSDADGVVKAYAFAVDGAAQASQSGATFTKTFTVAGPHDLGLVVVDNDNASSAPASLAIIVAAGPLATIALDPASAKLPAGGAVQFAASGADNYSNAVPVHPSWTADCGSIDGSGAYQAPTSAGSCIVKATDGSVSSKAPLTIVPAALAAIAVSGPGSLVAGAVGQYQAVGHDAYGNAIALDQPSISYTAPTTAGPAQVCASQDDVTGCLPISVVHDVLASIVVSGPGSLVAGSAASYALAGFDQYGNDVPLAQGALDYAAPTQAGAAQACYGEQGVQGCKPVTIEAGPLASIALTGPSNVVAGTSVTYQLAGSDQYGNAVPLARSALAYTAPTQAGPQQVCYSEQGIQGCLAVQVTPDAPTTITVSGPSQLVAGQSATYQLSATDQYGNAVQLAQSTLDYTAPTHTGTYDACYSERGATGCEAVQVVHAALASIVPSGPASMVAGTSATFTVAGFDAYGNDVPLAQPSFTHIAPTQAGGAQACYAEQGIQGCAPVQVVHDALASIGIGGPDSVQAGQSVSLPLSGADQYGNAVPLAQSALAYTAPTSPQDAQVCYSESGIQGCKVLHVVPGPLASIVLTGPGSVTAGGSATYALAGSDAYGNVVQLAQTSLAWTAPTLAGPAQACYAEQGVQGCVPVTVTAGPLAAIAVTGPSSLAAGASATYGLAGSDAYGNAVPLAQSTLGYTAPTLAGPQQVCYAEQGVSGCLPVTVTPGPLASIVLAGPDAVDAGAAAQFALAGSDAYGNAVPLAQSTLDYAAPQQAGPAQVCYAEQGIQGCKAITISSLALSVISVTGPSSVVAGQTATYALGGADKYGNAVQLAQGSLAWTAPQQAGPAQVCYSEQGVQGCAPVSVVHDALLTITVSGPSQLAAGASAVYQLAGADKYGNPVQLAQSSLDFTAPTAAPGDSNVCYSDQGASGCELVHIVPASLATIVVSGPGSLVAGSSASYGLAGFDQYGNSVPLAQGALAYTAPTKAGPAQACYAEQGIQGCASLVVEAGPLASIAVSGPGSLVAGSSASYDLAGFDQYLNEVPLAQSVLGFTAPTQAGAAQVCYAEQGIQGCKAIEVVHAALASIAVAGPGTVKAGSTHDYALAGSDVYGNAVPLAQSVLHWTAPGTVGPASACYGEQGIQGCEPVTVVAGDLAKIAVSPDPATVNVNERTLQFTAAGKDAYGNAVPLSGPVWSTSLGFVTQSGLYRPASAGTGSVTATAAGVAGSATVKVLDALKATVATNNPSYAYGQTPRGFAHVAFQDGMPLANTLVKLTFSQVAPSGAMLSPSGSVIFAGGPALKSTTIQVRTGTNGDALFTAPSGFDQPGSYRIDLSADWAGNHGVGSTTYDVGL